MSVLNRRGATAVRVCTEMRMIVICEVCESQGYNLHLREVTD